MSNKTEVTILGCGSSLGVPRIDGYWGRANKNNPKNYRTRCSVFVKYKNINVIIDTSPDIKSQMLKNKIDVGLVWIPYLVFHFANDTSRPNCTLAVK